eukprot:UN04656
MKHLVPLFKSVIKNDLETCYGLTHLYKADNILPNQLSSTTTASPNAIMPITFSTTKLKIIQWFNNLFNIVVNHQEQPSINKKQQAGNGNGDHTDNNNNNSTIQKFSEQQMKIILGTFKKEIIGDNQHIETATYILQSYINNQQEYILSSIDNGIDQELVIEAFKLSQRKTNDSHSSFFTLNHMNYSQFSHLLDYFAISSSYFDAKCKNDKDSDFQGLVRSLSSTISPIDDITTNRTASLIIKHRSLYETTDDYFNRILQLLILHVKYTPWCFSSTTTTTEDNTQIDNAIEYDSS